jgi:hypothetical protein
VGADDDCVSQGAECERHVEMSGEVVARRIARLVARRWVVDDRTSAASREVEECDQVKEAPEAPEYVEF